MKTLHSRLFSNKIIAPEHPQANNGSASANDENQLSDDILTNFPPTTSPNTLTQRSHSFGTNASSEAESEYCSSEVGMLQLKKKSGREVQGCKHTADGYGKLREIYIDQIQTRLSAMTIVVGGVFVFILAFLGYFPAFGIDSSVFFTGPKFFRAGEGYSEVATNADDGLLFLLTTVLVF